MNVPNQWSQNEDQVLAAGGTSCSCVVVQCCGIVQKVDPPFLVFVTRLWRGMSVSAVAPPFQPGGGKKCESMQVLV